MATRGLDLFNRKATLQVSPSTFSHIIKRSSPKQKRTIITTTLDHPIRKRSKCSPRPLNMFRFSPYTSVFRIRICLTQSSVKMYYLSILIVYKRFIYLEKNICIEYNVLLESEWKGHPRKLVSFVPRYCSKSNCEWSHYDLSYQSWECQ